MRGEKCQCNLLIESHCQITSHWLTIDYTSDYVNVCFLTDVHIVLPVFLIVSKFSENVVAISLTMRKAAHPLICLNPFCILFLFFYSAVCLCELHSCSLPLKIWQTRVWGFISLKKNTTFCIFCNIRECMSFICPLISSHLKFFSHFKKSDFWLYVRIFFAIHIILVFT